MNQAERIIHSYKQWTGKDLIDPSLPPEALFDADVAIVSHGTEPDPIFNYGNHCALEQFEMTWEAFTALPSRKSAEPVNRSERARLLDEVTRNGFINNYNGIRISSTGQRFRITNATVWNLVDEQGQPCGQAACFKDVENV